MGTGEIPLLADIAFWFEWLRRMTATTYIDFDHDPRFDKDLQPPVATQSLQKGTWHFGNLGRTNWELFRYEC